MAKIPITIKNFRSAERVYNLQKRSGVECQRALVSITPGLLSATDEIQDRNCCIEVLHGSHVAWQEQKILNPLGKEVLSYAKHFHCSCHATWLPCKTSIREKQTVKGVEARNIYFRTREDKHNRFYSLAGQYKTRTADYGLRTTD